MIPQSMFFRLNHRYNYVTCETPCNNCTCNNKPCDFLPIDADLYVEVDDKTFLPSTADPRN